ncbi:hypothetical protein RHGRI_003823 [Rhododendron griersonianum]|uniref:DUF4283 domain-containing protein n=1 Tax=Rhododendron griersonianum TaxID=479676 RepID=A0AAV6L776_9ERIC|nr:hypothetical protein RHGRI_003823 [Rhododendron griersonianum]
MAGVLMGNFPALLESLPNSRVSSQGYTIDLLDKAAAPTSDGPKIQDLKAELLQLKGLLAEKDKLLQQAVASRSGIPVPSSPVVPPVSWKDKVVAGETVVPRMALQYFAPFFVNEKLVVSPPEEVVLLGSEKWKDCVVGYFIDRKLPFRAVKSIAERIWAKFGLVDVLSNDEGFFFFQFDKVGAYRELIEAGPCHFGDRLLVLKQWHPHMCLEKEQVKKIPIWAQFYNVPLDLWTTQGLSYVASAVGKPLYADRTTETCQRLNYAKICVEIDVNSVLPDNFDIVLANGDKFSIKVWYPWRPLKCDKCKVFGHRTCQGVPKLGAKQQEDQFDQCEGGPGICLDEVHMPGFAQKVFCGGSTSDPNKFAVLQLSSDEVLPDGVDPLPFEAEFHDGLIQGLQPDIIPPAQKGKVTEKCDVYSFGVLTLEILMGSQPGELRSNLYSSVDNERVQLANVLDPRLPPPTSQKLRDELDSILNLAAVWCLCADPHSRPTMYDASQGIKEMRDDSIVFEELG